MKLSTAIIVSISNILFIVILFIILYYAVKPVLVEVVLPDVKGNVQIHLVTQARDNVSPEVQYVNLLIMTNPTVNFLEQDWYESSPTINLFHGDINLTPITVSNTLNNILIEEGGSLTIKRYTPIELIGTQNYDYNVGDTNVYITYDNVYTSLPKIITLIFRNTNLNVYELTFGILDSNNKSAPLIKTSSSYQQYDNYSCFFGQTFYCQRNDELELVKIPINESSMNTLTINSVEGSLSYEWS